MRKLGRLKDIDRSKLPTDIVCEECSARMELRDSKYGLFYGCTRFPVCRSTHGAHQDNGLPLGIPASKEVKQLRIAAHDAFDRLWKTKRMGRREAYRWMQKTMGMSSEEAHIGRFDAEKCQQLVQHVLVYEAQHTSRSNGGVGASVSVP